MSFWKTSGFTFESFSQLSDEKLILLLNGMSRNDLIDWLSWNDHNGIYHDEQSLKELGNVMTRTEGIEILLRQIAEGRESSTPVSVSGLPD
jgi:hypothetical protein